MQVFHYYFVEMFASEHMPGRPVISYMSKINYEYKEVPEPTFQRENPLEDFVIDIWDSI